MKNGIFIPLRFLLIFMICSSNWVFAAAEPHQVKSVKFLQVGEVSKVELQFDREGFKANRFHVTEDKQIILDIKNASAGPKILRGIDTSEFSGSVVYINVYKKPGTTNDVRLALQLRDNVRSILNASDNKLTLQIENRFGVFSKANIENANSVGDANIVTNDSGKVNVPRSNSIEDILENITQSGAKKYIGRKISLNVRNIPVIDILKMISETSGFNIIIDEEVKKVPPLTLSLTNIPWDQVLDTVLDLSKLTASKKSNILMVTTIAKATEEKRRQLEIEALNTRQEPLVTKVFPISYAVLGDIVKILGDYSTPQRGRISIDNRTNVVIVKDTIDVIDRMRKIINVLDTQTPQILIESKIVEAVESIRKQIGLSEGIRFGYDPVADKGTLATNATGPGFTFSSISGGDANGSADGSTFLGLTVGLFKRIRSLDITLQLMEQESKVKIVSSPKVITQNKQQAKLLSKETTSFLTTTVTDAGTVQSFANIDVDLELDVTPQVTNEGSINMKIKVNKASFGERPSAGAPPDTSNRQVETYVLVDNGSTIVIGGLYTIEKSESVKGIPFLKDLPLLGWLFRSAYNPRDRKTELIIFLTPRIINQEEAGLIERDGPLS